MIVTIFLWVILVVNGLLAVINFCTMFAAEKGKKRLGAVFGLAWNALAVYVLYVVLFHGYTP